MIYTSYFRSPLLRGWPQENLVAISIGLPAHWNGRWCKALAPTRAMISMEAERYDPLYAQILAEQDPLDICRRFDGCVLLCWERQKESCHRWKVAQWLQAAGVEVAELGTVGATLASGQEALL